MNTIVSVTWCPGGELSAEAGQFALVKARNMEPWGEFSFRVRPVWIWVSVLVLSSCVAVSKFLGLSGTWSLCMVEMILHTCLLRSLECYKQCVNGELPDVQAGFRKGRGTRDQIASIHWIIEKAREFQRNIYFCFIDHAKAFVWITINCGKF